MCFTKIINKLLASREWIHSVCSQYKLNFSIHIFIVDGFTLFKIDPSSCLNLKIENKSCINPLVSYSIKNRTILSAIPCKASHNVWSCETDQTILQNPLSCLKKVSSIWRYSTVLIFKFCIFQHNIIHKPVNYTAGLFNVVVLDEHRPSNELCVLAHHLAYCEFQLILWNCS